MTKAKAIGFDWGGVLNGKPGKFFGQRVSELLGITHEKYLEAYFHHNKKINRGELTWEELWSLVLTELGQPDKVQDVMKISQEFNTDSLNQNVLELAGKLRGLGYKTGLLSNNTHEKAALMRAKGLDKHFDVFHISAETGFVKPEPQAFNHFAEALSVQMDELIFIDDSEKSLSTAEECGFMPILFESYDQLYNELTQLGVING
jgi:putative hydrolase of the HAD superfamily